jgi:hypothetical protein
MSDGRHLRTVGHCTAISPFDGFRAIEDGFDVGNGVWATAMLVLGSHDLLPMRAARHSVTRFPGARFPTEETK